MKKNLLLISLVIILTFSLLISGCPKPAPTPIPEVAPTPAPPPLFLRIGTGPVGGYWYPLGAILASIIVEKIPGVHASPTIGAGVANVKDVHKGVKDIGWTFGMTAYEAWEALPPFAEKQINIRGIANLYTSPYHIFALKESGIDSVEKMKGKRISFGIKGMTGEILSLRLMELYGMSYADFAKVVFVGYVDGATLMKDKHLDVYGLITFPPSAPFLEVGAFYPLSVFTGSPEKVAEMIKKYPGLAPVTIPAGTYPGQDKDVHTFGSSNLLLIRKDIPEDIVYKITKELWAEHKRFWAVVAGFDKHILPENALLGMPIPLHKGAYKAYVEMGLTIPKECMPID